MPVLDCSILKADWMRQVGQRNGVAVSSRDAAAAGPAAGAGPWGPAVQKLIGYQHLGDDWDGLGARAPSRELLASAVGLAYLFYEKGVEAPHRVVAGVDGTVIMEWQDPDGTYTDVEIVAPFSAEVMLIEPGQAAKHWTLPTD